MGYRLSDEQELIKKNMREFCDRYIEPIAQETDENSRFPAEVFAKLGEMGWMGMPFECQYGGAGLEYLTYAIVMEEIAYSSAAVCVDLASHILTSLAINNYGSEEQKQQFLSRMTTGEWFGAFAITEPGAGTDMASLSTTAVLEGNDYIINGTKTFITNGPVADVFMLVAYTDQSQGSKGMSAFIIPRETPGFNVGAHFAKMGLRASQTSELILRNCRIPRENLLGQEGMGMKIAMTALDHGRIIMAAQAVGIAQAALDESIVYAKGRIQFGKPIASNQAIGWMIAEMATDIAAARLMYYHAANLKDKGLPFGKESSMAKIFASEMVFKHTSNAVQIHGGYGYTKGVKVERLMRDSRIISIYEGTGEALRMILSGQILK